MLILNSVKSSKQLNIADMFHRSSEPSQKQLGAASATQNLLG